MRVSKDPKDVAYDPRERKVFVSEKPVENWISADEFRRVVVCTDRTIFGDVYIERLPEVIKEDKSKQEVIEVSKLIADKPLANCDARFANSENKTKNPVDMTIITETPKYGSATGDSDYSLGNRIRFKDSK